MVELDTLQFESDSANSEYNKIKDKLSGILEWAKIVQWALLFHSECKFVVIQSGSTLTSGSGYR